MSFYGGGEIDLRESLVYDPYVKGFDSNFWKGDTANLLNDTVKNRIKIGDTGAAGSMSSYSQYLFGDFEFTMAIDSLSPDSNDSEKYFGLRNAGDTLQRGSAYFNLSYDTTAGDSSPDARSFSVVVYGEDSTRYRRFVTWDTTWGGGGILTRFRILWDADQYKFLINDTVVATIAEGAEDTDGREVLLNKQIPMALRLSNRSIDTTDTAVTALTYLNIRNARKVI